MDIVEMNGRTNYRDLKIRSKFPSDRSIVEHVMQQMQMIGDKRLHTAARDAGMNYTHFVFIRKLLMLKTWDTITADERQTIIAALDLVDKERRFTDALVMVDLILKRHWHEKTRDGRPIPRERSARKSRLKRKASERDRKRLDSTLFAIREACTNNDELEVPQLSADERREYLDLIIESTAALFDLRKKIVGERA